MVKYYLEKYKWFIVITFIIIFIMYAVTSRPKDEIALMEKLISKDSNTNQSITIYNEIIIDDHRLVSYILSKKNKYQGVEYAHFKRNSKGKQELLTIIEPSRIIEEVSDISMYEFSNLEEEFSNFASDKISIGDSLFIISNNPELSKIEKITDNEEIQEKKINTNPAISFFDPVDKDNRVEYKFYNKNGEIIE